MSIDVLPETGPSLPEGYEADPSFVFSRHVQERLNGQSIYGELKQKELDEVLALYSSSEGRESILLQLQESLENPEELVGLQGRLFEDLHPEYYTEEGDFDSSVFIKKVGTDLDALGVQIQEEEGWLETQVRGMRERAEVTKRMREGVGDTPEVREQQKTLLQNSLSVAKKVLSYPIRHPVKTALIASIATILAVSGAAYMA
ncbi:MAG: hypothetical protein KAS32_30440, partial [Candidatus Peribacteraceae bacterium]|nr:hypothetical protein [Candidatus Peribacteraceae bacterium]